MTHDILRVLRRLVALKDIKDDPLSTALQIKQYKELKEEAWAQARIAVKEAGTSILSLDRQDLLALVYGTHGPHNYVHPFEHVGEVTGFPNERWRWRDHVLDKMTDEQLKKLYFDIKTFNADDRKSSTGNK